MRIEKSSENKDVTDRNETIIKLQQQRFTCERYPSNAHFLPPRQQVNAPPLTHTQGSLQGVNI